MASGRGSCTSLNSLIACALASALVEPKCSCIASVTWKPQVSTGLSDVMGSWNIMAILLPRMARISSSDNSNKLNSSSITCPLTTELLLSSKRISDNAVTDLPEPDSPTIPMVSPLARVKLIPLTASNKPFAVLNWIVRLVTLSILTNYGDVLISYQSLATIAP